MHCAHVSYFYDAQLKTPDDYFNTYRTIVGWGEALVRAGARVTIFQRFHRNVQQKRHGVLYIFQQDNFPSALRWWHIPRTMQQAVVAAKPDVVHVHSLLYPLATRQLRQSLPRSIPVVVQHHAERPPKNGRGWLNRFAFRQIDGLIVAAEAHAKAWKDIGQVPLRVPVAAIMEGSTRFAVEDRAIARAQTGMRGSPVFLWVGRLNANKDPMTVLSGFAQLRKKWPEAQLHMIFHDDELRPLMEHFIDRAGLDRVVSLLGSRPYSTLTSYYNSADYFVLGSHYEGSGYSVCEALACGAVPIVTDIPTFRMMTDGGRIGGLWQPGNADSFGQCAETVLAKRWETQSQLARDFFEAHLSFDAIASQAVNFYTKLCGE